MVPRNKWAVYGVAEPGSDVAVADDTIAEWAKRLEVDAVSVDLMNTSGSRCIATSERRNSNKSKE